MENKEEQAGASVLPIRSAPQVENDQDQASHTAQNETLEASNVQKLQEQDDDRGEEEDMMAEIDLTLPEKKKKKKRSKKPKSKRGLVRGDLYWCTLDRKANVLTEQTYWIRGILR